jgi:hypothetical protein
MVDPVTVWRVRLRRGDVREREGTLRLDAAGLVFVEADSASEELVPFEAIRSARRVRASPILLVVHHDADGRAETAFYFSQPPPLEVSAAPGERSPSSGRPLGPFAAMRRTSKRRHQRENVKYLTTKAGAHKATIQAWADEISARSGR